MSRRLLLGYLGLVLVVLVALEVPLGVENARTERRTLEARLERDATTLGSLASDAVQRPTQNRLDGVAAIAYRYRTKTGARVVIVNRNGRVLIDTNPAGGGARSFASRPEIKSALRGLVAAGTRRSETLHTKLLYVATPVAVAGRVHGAVRLTYSTSAVDARIRRYWLVLLAIAGIVLAVAATIGIRLAAFVSRPLRGLERAATAVGRGDLSARAPENEGPPEVRSLAAVFNETVARLEQLLKSQEEFVADASHQLRTPLTGLRLRLENLTRDVAQRGHAELSGALAEVERLGVLVDSLLALARADAGGGPAGRVDLAELVEERIGAWTALAEERGLNVVAETDGTPVAHASRDRLGQVLDNLMENAVEASPPGGTITVTARAAPSWVELRVRDQGPGLTAAERNRAFDRFWRGRRGDGSGLGLAIVRRLVEADGGSVLLEPAEERGLEAIVKFPA